LNQLIKRHSSDISLRAAKCLAIEKKWSSIQEKNHKITIQGPIL
jgi:hypothetical protein